MTEGLPKGLIATSDNVSSEIEREDRVSVEDISKLWRGTFGHCKTPFKDPRLMFCFLASILSQQRCIGR